MRLDNYKCIGGKDINVDEYIKYYEMIKSTMTNPEWLGDFDKKSILSLISNGANIWMYFDEDIFVSSIMYIPGDSDMNTICSLEENIPTCECGPLFVNPDYRGLGLQKEMLNILEDYSECNYVITTVHPNNEYCINNFIGSDYEFVKTCHFKRGPRNIYIKKIL